MLLVKFKKNKNIKQPMFILVSGYSKNDMEDVDLLSQIDNYWELRKSQVIAYGYLVFNHFRISCEELTTENITKNFVYQMKFYSPDNAVEFVERNFNIDLYEKDL